MRARISRTIGWYRYTNGTVATTPASAAAATSSAACAGSIARGFSHTTLMPAAITASACGWCWSFGVQMCTTSGASAMTSSREA